MSDKAVTHVRFKPLAFVTLSKMYADRVQIDTDNLTVPRGVWLRINEQLLKRLQKQIDGADVEEKRDRITELKRIIESRVQPLDCPNRTGHDADITRAQE